ncbi:MAG: cytochrome P450 [Acidimicrobiales bacterium]|jgi:cytochrome P450
MSRHLDGRQHRERWRLSDEAGIGVQDAGAMCLPTLVLELQNVRPFSVLFFTRRPKQRAQPLGKRDLIDGVEVLTGKHRHAVGCDQPAKLLDLVVGDMTKVDVGDFNTRLTRQQLVVDNGVPRIVNYSAHVLQYYARSVPGEKSLSGRGPAVADHIDIDLFDPASFASGVPHPAFATLRAQAPVAFHEERPKRRGGRSGPGFWCVTTHEHVHEVSRQPDIYSSFLGGFTASDISGAVLDETRMNLMGMDPPDHTAFRAVLRDPFGPRIVRDLEATVEGFAVDIVDRLVIQAAATPDGEAIDFVDAVAKEIPLLVLANLLGIRADDRQLFFDWSNRIIGNHDPDVGGSVQDFLAAKDELFAYGRQVIAEKRIAPGDDLISAVVGAELDGKPVDEQKIVMLWFLLLIAGNETTRSSLTGAMEMLSTHSDQRELLMSELDLNLPGFVEETLRCTNPVLHFRRTAAVDTELGGVQIKAGDKVVLWYPSANADEKMFDDPMRFDLTRSPNQHLAFGIGTHFCLGARLARLQMRVMLKELLTRCPNIEVSGPARRIHSNFLHGALTLPVTV